MAMCEAGIVEWKKNTDNYIQFGIAFDEETNKIYIAEANDCKGRITVLSQELVYVKSFNIIEMKSPHGIAIHKTNLYLTDYKEHCVTHYTQEGDQINFAHKFGSRGRNNDQFSYPGQLAVSPEGELYIPDRTNKRIQILDETLKYKRTIKHESITHPRDVKLKDFEIFVLNSTPHCILVFSQDGMLITSLLLEELSKTIHTPNFFCMNSQDLFLITDNESKLINVFLITAGLSKTIGGSINLPFEIDRINGIAWVNNNAITIFSTENIKPQIITIESKQPVHPQIGSG